MEVQEPACTRQGQDLNCNQFGAELQLLQYQACTAGFGGGLKELCSLHVFQSAGSSPASARTVYAGHVLCCVAVRRLPLKESGPL